MRTGAGEERIVQMSIKMGEYYVRETQQRMSERQEQAMRRIGGDVVVLGGRKI